MYNPEVQRHPSSEEKNIVDRAAQDGIETVRTELEDRQKKSQDNFFKQMNIRELKPEALMLLKTSLDENGSAFSKDVISNALVIAEDSPNYFDKVVFDDPQKRLDYLKELIARYPNTFYKKREKF